MVALATKVIIGHPVEPALNIMENVEKVGCKVSSKQFNFKNYMQCVNH